MAFHDSQPTSQKGIMNKFIIAATVFLFAFTASATPRHRRHVTPPAVPTEWCFEVPMNGVTCIYCEDTRLQCNQRRNLLPHELHRYVEETECRARPKQ